MNETTLWIARAHDISLACALTRLPTVPGPRLGLFYAPRAWGFGLLRSDGLLQVGPGREEVFTDAPYEARIFDDAAELRWIETEGGRAALLTEKKERADAFDTKAGSRSVTARSVSWLLRGKITPRLAGTEWVELAAAQVGAWWVPYARADASGRVHLHAVEYLATAEDGNIVLHAERLVGLCERAAEERS